MDKDAPADVEKVLEGLDDNLNPITGDDSKKDDPAKDDVVADDKGKKDDTKDDDGYTADDPSADDPEPPKSKKGTQKSEDTAEIDTSALSDEGKYIAEKLPYISARIKDGDGVKVLNVKSWTQLPDDVEFATKRDELAFMNALTAQENRAQALQREFQESNQKRQNDEFVQRENAGIRQDIADLQKAGVLPKFKAKVDDPEFNKDPATKEIQKVLTFMNKQNEQ